MPGESPLPDGDTRHCVHVQGVLDTRALALRLSTIAYEIRTDATTYIGTFAYRCRLVRAPTLVDD